jgi:hypothetical protein
MRHSPSTPRRSRAEFSKIYPGPRNEVSNSLGYKHLASVGQRADAGCDMNGYAGYVVAAQHTFACMNAYPQI